MPPPAAGDGPGVGPLETDANTDSSRTPPGWPSGHVAADDDSLIGRRSS
jgi:hypothetical protein